MRKTNTLKMILALLFLLLFLFNSFGQEKPEWKGTIEIEDGVTIVKNPKAPMYGEKVFNLEEELRIGERNGRKEYMFSRLSQLVINDRGDIYALDILENHIKMFNKNGEYVKTIGRKGQGPGEISGLPTYFSLSNQNELILVDQSGVSFFSLGGDFLRRIAANRFESQVQFFHIDRNSNVYIFARDPNNRDFELNKFDLDLNFIKRIESSSTQSIQSIRNDGWNPFYPMLFCDFSENGKIICGRNENYEIRVYNEKSELEMKIQREYASVKLSQVDIEDYLRGISPQEIKRMDLPAFLPSFKYIRIDSEGKIYVSTFERVKDMKGFYYDVFSEKGMYLVKIPLQSYPFFKDDRLYMWLDDSDGYQYIKRYKITWKL